MGCIIILAHYGMATEQFIVLWDGTVAKQTYQGFIQVSVGYDKCIGPVTFEIILYSCSASLVSVVALIYHHIYVTTSPGLAPVKPSYIDRSGVQ